MQEIESRWQFEYVTFDSEETPVKMKLTKRYKCSQCDSAYGRKDSLLEHIDTKHKGIVFPCPKCPSGFSRSKTLSKHIKEHHSETTCHICHFETSGEITIKWHIETSHIIFECKECEKMFTSKAHLSFHTKKYHSGKAEKKEEKKNLTYDCKNCGKHFKSKRRLKEHNLSIHLNIWLECSECQKKYDRKDSLLRHLFFGHSKPCKFCLFKGTISELKNHVKIHRLDCNNCKFKTFDKIELESHRKFYHQMCNNCNFEMTAPQLEVHILKCNIEQCGLCDYRGSLKKMKQHLRTHLQKERIEQCGQCDYRGSLKQMKQHLRIHLQKERMYPCSLCDYQASKKQFIHMHLRNIHNTDDQFLEEGSHSLETSNESEQENSKECQENSGNSVENLRITTEISTNIDENNGSNIQGILEKVQNDIHKTGEEIVQYTKKEKNITRLEGTSPSNQENEEVVNHFKENETLSIIQFASLISSIQTSENDKNIKLTCNSRNLQIFPVNKIEENKKTNFSQMENISPIENESQIVYKSRWEDKSQMGDETQIKEKECPECSFSTEDEELYQHHQVTDHLLCYICGFTSEYQMFIFSHMKAIHNILDFEEEEKPGTNKCKPSVCPICSHRSKSKAALERHKVEVHSKQTFRCPKCGHRFIKFKFIFKHYQILHDKDVDSKTVYDECLIE